MRRDLLGNLQTAAIPEVRGNSRRLNGEAILRAGSKIRVRHGKIPEEPLHDFVQCYKLGEGRRGQNMVILAYRTHACRVVGCALAILVDRNIRQWLAR